MIRVIITEDVRIRDGFSSLLSLERIDDTEIKTTYRKGSWILMYYKIPFTRDNLEDIEQNYTPDRLYMPFLGYSVDMIHEIGDIIVPNVFLTYDSKIENIEVTEQNRDTFHAGVRFLSHLDEQKDYFVEDYGLNIGGIILSGAPNNPSPENITRLMMAYEADAYVSSDLDQSIDSVEENAITSMILCAIIEGKTGKYQGNTLSVDFALRNMITTIRLLEEE